MQYQNLQFDKMYIEYEINIWQYLFWIFIFYLLRTTT